jgi:hypothetical protein
MPVAYALTRLTGWFVGDIVLTWEEYQGLMSGLLTSQSPSAGATRLSDWLRENRESLGRLYASEIVRHF